MRILVTGANGQLGREWAEFLEMKGIPFHGTGREALDITNHEHVKRTLDKLKPGIIINCAAYTNVDGAESNVETACKVNRDAVGYLAGWCYRNNAKMVHYSTDYVFSGSSEDEVNYPDGYPENALIDPVNSYGESKAAGEKILSESGVDFLLIRISWLSGRYGKNFVKTILKNGIKKTRLKVVDDQRGSPTFTDSAVDMTYKLLETGFSGYYHISSGGLITWYDYAVEIIRLAGIETEIIPVTSDEYPFIAKRPAFSKLDCSKICNDLHVEMGDWKTGLEKLIKKLI